MLAVTFVMDLVVRAFPLSPAELEMFKELGSGSVGAIVITTLLAPVLEEMLFRGIILRSFLLQYPKWLSILGSALIFGAAHMNLYQFTAAFMLGMCLGWLYQRSRSLVPCIVLHAVYNATLLGMSLMGEEWAADQFGNQTALLLAVAVVIGAGRSVSLLRHLLPSQE
ncbi:CPBP family intramembrane metalloprotease [Massilia sp. B-10]|nr:CPBP family intramembrane metalloprotease [Massilia sp. B-10]